MKELTVIEGLKVYGTKEEPLFLAKDIAELLGIKQSSVMLNSVDDDEKVMNSIHTLGGNQQVWFLKEHGVYEVLMLSRKPIAKRFKKKVKNHLTELRKHGMTATPEMLENFLNDPNTMIKTLEALRDERAARIAAENTVNTLTHDDRNSYYIEDIAKELHMTGIALYKMLVEKKIVFKKHGVYYQYRDYATWFEHKDDLTPVGPKRVLKVNQRGRIGILNLINTFFDNVYPIREAI